MQMRHRVLRALAWTGLVLSILAALVAIILIVTGASEVYFDWAMGSVVGLTILHPVCGWYSWPKDEREKWLDDDSDSYLY